MGVCRGHGRRELGRQIDCESRPNFGGLICDFIAKSCSRAHQRLLRCTARPLLWPFLIASSVQTMDDCANLDSTCDNKFCPAVSTARPFSSPFSRTLNLLCWMFLGTCPTRSQPPGDELFEEGDIDEEKEERERGRRWMVDEAVCI